MQNIAELAATYRARAEERSYRNHNQQYEPVYTYAPVLLTGHVGRYYLTERPHNYTAREARPWFGTPLAFTGSQHEMAAIWRGEMTHRWRRNPAFGKGV